MISFSYYYYHQRGEKKWEPCWRTSAFGIPEIISLLERIDWSRVANPMIEGTLILETKEYRWDGATLIGDTTETNKMLQELEALLKSKKLQVSEEKVNKDTVKIQFNKLHEAEMTLELKCNEFKWKDVEKNEESRLETNEFLQKLATFLQSNGYYASVDEEDKWRRKVVIKFEASERNKLVDTLRKFNE